MFGGEGRRVEGGVVAQAMNSTVHSWLRHSVVAHSLTRSLTPDQAGTGAPERGRAENDEDASSVSGAGPNNDDRVIRRLR